MALLITAVLSIFFSFLCSILEAVLLSITPTFLNTAKEEKKSFALGLEKLKKDVDRPLIAILTLNTVAHTVGAIMVGNLAGEMAKNEPWNFETFGGLNFVAIVSGVMTFLILVASEIIPKTIGATYWKKLAGITTSTLNIMVGILKYTGILWFMTLITRFFGSSEHESVFSRQDFSTMATVAEQSGELEDGESKIIKNLIQLEQLSVNDIMTPRSVIKLANQELSLQEFFSQNKNLHFSRIPIYSDETDNITGYILKDDLFLNIIEGYGETKKLNDIRRDIYIAKSTDTLDELFKLYTNNNTHISIVEDQYGSVVGLVTMEDLVETLLGLEIMDEYDNIEDLQKLARQKWEKRAKARGLVD